MTGLIIVLYIFSTWLLVSHLLETQDKWILFCCCDESEWTCAHCSPPSLHMFQQLLGCLFFKFLLPANIIWSIKMCVH